MTLPNIYLFWMAFGAALIMGLILTPAARAAAILFDVIDRPHSTVKTHKEPVPYLGGAAIFLAFAMTLLWVRVLTSFPTGTLRSLRGILFGGFLIFLLGLLDDAKHQGLHYRTKFFFQLLAALVVMAFGVRIRFVEPDWLAAALSILWIVGITNAVNLIDIMDGLASAIVGVAALAFLLISLPTEEIYVNFAAAALAGSVIGFLPFNLSRNLKIFMGDSGSLFLGFVVSVLALGTSYEGPTDLSVFAPILILAIPIFDTLAVFILRIRRGMSPFLGSKDHYALRLEALGWSRPRILVFSAAAAGSLSYVAYFVTRHSVPAVIAAYGAVTVAIVAFSAYILRAKI